MLSFMLSLCELNNEMKLSENNQKVPFSLLMEHAYTPTPYLDLCDFIFRVSVELSAAGFT